jgi:hypothetical protein
MHCTHCPAHKTKSATFYHKLDWHATTQNKSRGAWHGGNQFFEYAHLHHTLAFLAHTIAKLIAHCKLPILQPSDCAAPLLAYVIFGLLCLKYHTRKLKKGMTFQQTFCKCLLIIALHNIEELRR